MTLTPHWGPFKGKRQVLLEETGGFSPAMRSSVKHRPDLQERGEVILRLGQGSETSLNRSRAETQGGRLAGFHC